MNVIENYTDQLDEHPLVTKSISSAFIAALSDILAQRITGAKLRSWRLRRTVAIFLYGLLYQGPSGHHWQVIRPGAVADCKQGM